MEWRGIVNKRTTTDENKESVGMREFALELRLDRLIFHSYSRITTLLDPGTSFLELSTLAGEGLYEGEDVPCGGIVAGVGQVEGVRCMIVGNDST